MSPHLSVIIPAHNEEEVLPTLLADLAVQHSDPSHYEVIVVADRCTDATAAIARAQGAHVFECDAGNGSIAKNTGAARAQGSLLLFIDADSRLPDPHFLTAFLNLTNHPSDKLIATCRYQPQEHHSMAYLIASVKNHIISRHLLRTANGCFAMSRSLFHTSGGFHANAFPFEQINLTRRALRHGGTFTFLSQTVVSASMRRYERLGYLRTLAWWAIATIRYLSPLPPLQHIPASALSPREADAENYID